MNALVTRLGCDSPKWASRQLAPRGHSPHPCVMDLILNVRKILDTTHLSY
jgi:hypothetical protein